MKCHECRREPATHGVRCEPCRERHRERNLRRSRDRSPSVVITPYAPRRCRSCGSTSHDRRLCPSTSAKIAVATWLTVVLSACTTHYEATGPVPTKADASVEAEEPDASPPEAGAVAPTAELAFTLSCLLQADTPTMQVGVEVFGSRVEATHANKEGKPTTVDVGATPTGSQGGATFKTWRVQWSPLTMKSATWDDVKLVGLWPEDAFTACWHLNAKQSAPYALPIAAPCLAYVGESKVLQASDFAAAGCR